MTGDTRKTTPPLVSVLVLSYNQKDFLAECLDSILGQGYPNMEVVVTDDASTDGTLEMLRAYSERWPGVLRVVTTPVNTGITGNSNRGLRACRGKYIAWLGGDDLLLPGKIAAQVEYMESHPECVISYHNLDVFDSDSGATLRLWNNATNTFQGDVRAVVRHGTFNGACANMWRADRMPAWGFDAKIPMASDWLFWVELLVNGGEIHYIDQVLARYRRHAGNITRKRLVRANYEHVLTGLLILRRYPRLWSDVLYRYLEGARNVVTRNYQ